MAWFYLFIAGIFEVIWAISIKYCTELRLSFALFALVFSMVFSIIFLGMAIKTIPMSIAYAIWSGIGIVGVFLYDIIVLEKSLTTMHTIFIIIIVVGIIGLKLTLDE